jgi:ubiquinone/menaquinone biosynthesis C-methylase UbiE
MVKVMSQNTDLYEGYSDLHRWDKKFSPSTQERRLYCRELKEISLKGKQLLDVGFGKGSFLVWAKQNGAFVSGVEIQNELRSIAADEDIPVFSDICEVSTEQYDIVVLFDVLEHQTLEEIPQFIEEIFRVLKKGGVILFKFPNCQSPAGMVNQFGDFTHRSMLSGPIVECFVKRAGFECVTYRAAKELFSDNIFNRIVKFAIRPFLYLFECGFRLCFSNRSTILSPNVFLQATKPKPD